MTVIDTYLKKVAAPERAVLLHVCEVIQSTVPEAEEVITYAMPGFKYQGKYLISFAPFKKHMSIFPGGHAVEVLGDKLNGYYTSKGTVQFTVEKPLTDALLKKIVKICKDDIDKARK